MARQNLWRYTSLDIRFLWVFDARAGIAFFPLALHLRLSTFIFCLLVFLFFGALAWYGYTIPVMIRRCRSLLAGKFRLAVPWYKKTQMTLDEMKYRGG